MLSSPLLPDLSSPRLVLHQIRHMVGASVAAVNGIVPRDVLATALGSPLKVDRPNEYIPRLLLPPYRVICCATRLSLEAMYVHMSICGRRGMYL